MWSWRGYSSTCLHGPWESRLQADKVVRVFYTTLYRYLPSYNEPASESPSASHGLQHLLQGCFSEKLVPELFPMVSVTKHEHPGAALPSSTMETSNPTRLYRCPSDCRCGGRTCVLSSRLLTQKNLKNQKSACKID